MKKILSFLPIFVLVLTSCDKVELPYKPVITLDTTLYTDGKWETYPWPTFEENTNANRNLLVEDYTGHKCPNCPAAAIVAKQMEQDHPDRVFSVAIHAGPGGSEDFQKLATDCGEATNPDDQYCHDFRTPEGYEYGVVFGNFGFTGNPAGSVNRAQIPGANMVVFYTGWNIIATELMNANNLIVNLQAKSNYYEQSKGVFLHVEAEFVQAYDKPVNIVTYVIEDEIVTWQDDNGTPIPDYKHHNVFLGCIDGQTFGQSIGQSFAAGDKVQKDYSYVLPEGKTPDDLHFITYVHDVETYEILQVIKHDF